MESKKTSTTCRNFSKSHLWVDSLNIDNPLDRDAPSKMLEISLMMSGVKIIRTHEVKSLSNMRDLIFT